MPELPEKQGSAVDVRRVSVLIVLASLLAVFRPPGTLRALPETQGGLQVSDEAACRSMLSDRTDSAGR